MSTKPHQGSSALSPLEIDALFAAVDGLFEAQERMREALAEFDALPPPETATQEEARARLRVALQATHLEMLMPSISMYGVLKKFSARRASH